MTTIPKNYQVSFKTNNELYEQAKEIFASKNLSMTEVMNEFLSTVVLQKDIPFVTENDRKKQAIVAEMKSEIDKSFVSLAQNKFVTQEEMKRKYGL